MWRNPIVSQACIGRRLLLATRHWLLRREAEAIFRHIFRHIFGVHLFFGAKLFQPVRHTFSPHFGRVRTGQAIGAKFCAQIGQIYGSIGRPLRVAETCVLPLVLLRKFCCGRAEKQAPETINDSTMRVVDEKTLLGPICVCVSLDCFFSIGFRKATEKKHQRNTQLGPHFLACCLAALGDNLGQASGPTTTLSQDYLRLSPINEQPRPAESSSGEQ